MEQAAQLRPLYPVLSSNASLFGKGGIALSLPTAHRRCASRENGEQEMVHRRAGPRQSEPLRSADSTSAGDAPFRLRNARVFSRSLGSVHSGRYAPLRRHACMPPTELRLVSTTVQIGIFVLHFFLRPSEVGPENKHLLERTRRGFERKSASA